MPPKRKADGDVEEEEDIERKRQLIEDIKTKIQDLDEDSAMAYVHMLCERWQLDSPPASFEHTIALAFHNFKHDVLGDIDKDRTGSYGVRDVADTIHEHEIEAMSLYHRLRELDILAEHPDILRKVKTCLESIFYAKRMVLAAFQSKISMLEADHELDDDIDSLLGSWSLRFRWMDDSINDLQKLLLHLLDAAMEKRYRKVGDRIFEPIVVDGYNTHAWRSVGDMEQFVYSECQKEIQFDAWKNLTNGNTNAKAAISYLEKSNDYQFPRLIKDRNVWAFRNGVYLGKEDRFHRFATAETPLATSVVACKFFDFDLDYPADDVHWSEIPTPAAQSVFEYQGFSPEVLKWFYVLLGRMMYPVGDRDGWQVIPFLLGAAGAGKSSITNNVVAELYDSTDVGLLSNNSEKQFGLSAFYDKFIFVAPEIKSDMRLEHAEFQSMCSGEDIQIAIKHKTAFSVKWSPPGFLAGNECPSFTDNSGSIQRRVIIFNFERPVIGGDMLLGNRLKEEMGSLIIKANRAYLEASAQYGSKNIWEVLPNYFKSTRNEMAAAVNSVEAFLGSSDVILDPTKYCPFDDFKCALKVFENQNGYKGSKFTTDFFRGPFTKFKLSRVRDQMEYRGRSLKREYVLGIDLVQRDDFNALG
jgi:hypothetical protein